MESCKQHTLKRTAFCTGIGLHSGKKVKLSLRPAAPDTGIVFVRKDLSGEPHIRAAAGNVSSTVRATTLREGSAEVFTIEHLMAALAMQEVDNCFVEMSSPEPPVTDGSALEYCRLIEEAGLAEQDAPRRIYALDKAFAVYDGNRYMVAVPSDEYRISFTSMNKHPMLGTQYFDVPADKETLLREIASARTVAFMNEIEQMKKAGLGLGGSLENVVIFTEDKVLAPMRFENELIRHKILDVIGDMYLLGPIKAHIIAVQSGHAFNSRLAKKIESYRLKEEL